ncbi:MAG: hypothetical protein R3C11_24215 [Planctomycetaceae bacterium]
MNSDKQHYNNLPGQQGEKVRIEPIKPNFPDITFDELLQEAIDDYNSSRNPNEVILSKDSAPETLHQVAVDYARSQYCFNYVVAYYRTLRNLEQGEAKRLTCNSLFSHIGRRWPELADECSRQAEGSY